MGKMKKITVTEKIVEDSIYDLDGLTLDEVIDWVDRIKKQFGAKYHTLRLSVNSYGYEGGTELAIHGDREETEAEYSKRVEKARKEREKKKNEKALKESREYNEYLKLKAKFDA